MNEAHSKATDLDLNLLKVFEAVYREQHLSRAAEGLFLTPSAVSHALRRLREHLDDPLFERDGRTMRPTSVCRRLATDILDTLAGLRRVLNRAKTFDPSISRQSVRIGIPDHVEPIVLPPLMKRLGAAAPHIDLATVRTEHRAIERELGSGRLELVVDVAQPATHPVRHLRLARQKLCVLMREGHPFEKRLTLKRYLSARHIVVSGRRWGLAVAEPELQRLGDQRHVRMRCQNYHAAAMVVAESDDLLTLPESLATQIDNGRSNRIRPPPLGLPSLDLHMYWHANAEDDPAHRWLRELVAASIQQSALVE